MFAIAFDLVVSETQKRHPRGIAQAYIAATVERFGFRRVQGSVYVSESEDLANLFLAMQALASLQMVRASVRDIRAFRIEQWSDFTGYFKA
jgi:virulence-associated protein VapD